MNNPRQLQAHRPAPGAPPATPQVHCTRRDFLRSGVVALLPGAAACLHSPTDGQVATHGNPRLTARPRTPTVEPTIGESALGIGAFVDGFMYVPASYDPDVPIPLAVALHGATRSSSDWTGFFDACEDRGIVMLATDSRTRTWDRVGGFFGNDVRFLDAALNHVYDRINVDVDRSALIGFSDGASYALSLGLSNGDIFPNIVAWSPGFSGPAPPLVGTPKIFVSHGTSDTILPFTSTRDRIVPDLRAAGYDVTFVDYEGGHTIPSTIAAAGLDFFLG